MNYNSQNSTEEINHAHLMLSDVKKEHIKPVELKVTGKIPSFLSGKLYRIGPAKFCTALSTVRHWFDGFGHVSCFKIKDGGVKFCNKFLKSRSYKHHKALFNLNTIQGIGSTPSMANPIALISLVFRVIRNIIPPILWDGGGVFYNTNPNVNLIKSFRKTKNGKDIFLANTDGNYLLEIDENINELDDFRNGGIIKGGQLHAAHPELDKKRRLYYNITTAIGVISWIKIVAIDPVKKSVTILKRIPRLFPSYTHSLSQTENYVIYIEHPFVMLFTFLLLLPFISPLSISAFVPFFKTNVFVLDKRTKKTVYKGKTNPFFFFHTTNGYETDDGKIVLELASYKTSPMRELMINKMKSCSYKKLAPNYVRYTIDLKNKSISSAVPMQNLHIDLQRINERFKNLKHNFVYGLDAAGFRGIVKADFANSEIKTFTDPDLYFGEPVFVENPSPKGEDDGILLVLCTNVKKEKSELLGIDAKNMKEMFRAEAPIHITIGFHGHFARNNQSA